MSKFVFLLCLLPACLVLAACEDSSTPIVVDAESSSVDLPLELANPASEYCIEHGGQPMIQTASDGSQLGICQFPDTSTCDEWAFYRGDCQPGSSKRISSPGEDPEHGDASNPQPVTAWVGSIHGLPPGDLYDDYVEWIPSGIGETGLQGTTPDLEAAIFELRDASGVGQFVHLWGNLQCGVDDYGGCRLLVSDLQYGVFQTQDPFDGWTGTVTCSHFNSGPDYTCGNSFTLSGPYAVQFGLWSPDPALLAQLENLRDSATEIRISGTLLAGVPDVNGTQLQVSTLEIIPEE